MVVGLAVANYKSLSQVDNLRLSDFHVLVGPNGSGKSTFLDVFDFVRDCLAEGPRQAVESRAPEFRDLTSMRRGGRMAFHLWLDLPAGDEETLEDVLCYQLALEPDDDLGVRIAAEELSRHNREAIQWSSGLFNPNAFLGQQGTRLSRLLGKTSTGNDYYQRERGNYTDHFTFGPDRLALSMTPADEERYPTANRVRRFLLQGIRYVQLNSRAMRLPCPATRAADALDLDGTNLARVVGRLLGRGNGARAGEGSEAVERWTRHLRYVLPDLEAIGWDQREADNAEFVVLRYNSGLSCPSWLASDGTLRMLALTLPAFLPPSPGIYMVEEPENGIHPLALEVVLRSLSTIPEAQTMVASHSPLVVAQVGREPLLCFSKIGSSTKVQPGADHPALREWDGLPDLASVFAAGILG